jgi:hypothetical protein
MFYPQLWIEESIIGLKMTCDIRRIPRSEDGKVKLDGENVTEFPKLPEFQQVTLKVTRWEEKDKRFIIKNAELVA